MLVTPKVSKFTLFSKKTKVRWFEVTSERFHGLEGSEPSSNDINVLISNITDVKLTSVHAAIAKEFPYSFEIETPSQVYPFGCPDLTVRDQWLTAIHASLEKYILHHSSYADRKRECVDRTVRSVIKFADMFRKQGAIYSSITLEAQRFTIDNEHGINVNDIHEVSLYLQNEMLAAGLSSKLLQIYQEFLLIPAKMEAAWDAIYNGIRIIRKHSTNKKMLENGEKSSKLVKEAFVGADNPKSFVKMLKSKMEEAGSLYPEVSRLAMITIAHEKEKNELLDRIRKLEEEYLTSNGDKKKLMSIAEANEQMRIMRMTQKIKDLEEFFASDQIRIQKQDNRIKELENELEACRAVSEELKSVKLKLAEFEKKTEGVKNVEGEKKPPGLPPPNPFLAQLKRVRPVEETAPAPEIAPAATAVNTEAEEAFNKKFFKYKMMKKVLPEAAVRQKMSLDGFSQEEIEQFLSGAHSAAPLPPPLPSLPAAAAPPPAPSQPDKFEKYRTMKKFLPLPVIQHKMTADGVPEADIKEFMANIDGQMTRPTVSKSSSGNEMDTVSLSSISIGVTSCGNTSGEDSHSSSSSSSNSASISDSSASNSISFFMSKKSTNNGTMQYEALRKELPPDQLKQKMIADGVPEAEIDRILSKPLQPVMSNLSKFAKSTDSTVTDSECLPDGLAEKELKVKPSVKLKGLFWSKLKPAELRNTVFVHLSDFQIPEPVCKIIDDLFAAKVVASAANKSNSESSKDPSCGGSKDPTQPSTEEANNTKPAQLVSVLDSKRIQNVLIVMGKLRLGPEEIMNMIIDLDPKVLTAEMTASIISILPLTEEVNALKFHSSPTNLDQASKLYYYICRIPRLVTRLDCHEIAFSWPNFSKQVTSQMEIMSQACAEMEKCKNQMQSVLSIVLALGNYLNADTKFGKAHGFKIDAINKLESLKASKSAGGSMMNILASLVTEHVPDAVQMSQSWIAIPAAANVSLQQTVCDVNKLEQQVNKMNQEFLRIKDSQENVGLDGVLETCKGSVTYPIHRRLNEFLISAKPKIGAIKTDMKAIEKNVAQVMAMYGEKFSIEGDEDLFKKFFSSICLFFRSLRLAVEENLKKKKAQEKLLYQEQEQKARLARKEASMGLGAIGNHSNGSNSNANGTSISPKIKIVNRMRPRRLNMDASKEAEATGNPVDAEENVEDGDKVGPLKKKKR